MNVFVAGASGAIGHPLIAELVPPGVYHIVDDNPSPVSLWLPAFARALGAPPPPVVSEQDARAAAGADAVYYGTRLRGASNAKARTAFGFAPRRLEWLSTRRQMAGDPSLQTTATLPGASS